MLGALVSNKILYENKKISFCYREESDNEYDSGWVILCGDESDEYLNIPGNMEYLSLEDLFKIDKRLKDYIDLPVGSAIEIGKEIKVL